RPERATCAMRSENLLLVATTGGAAGSALAGAVSVVGVEARSTMARIESTLAPASPFEGAGLAAAGAAEAWGRGPRGSRPSTSRTKGEPFQRRDSSFSA